MSKTITNTVTDSDVLVLGENVFVTAFGAETYAAVAPEMQREIEAAARKRLEEAVMDANGPKTVPVVMTSSTPAYAIVDYARDHEVDLVIMGTHGRGAVGRLLMGSVAERVVRTAPCPVLTVRSRERDFVHPDTLVAARTTTSTGRVS